MKKLIWLTACLLDASGCHGTALKSAPRDGATTSGSDAVPSNADAMADAHAVIFASQQQIPWALAVDNANVYWFNLGTALGTGKDFGGYVGGQIVRCAKNGCEGGPALLASDRRSGLVAAPLAFAIDDANVYWSDAGTTTLSDASSASGGVLKCSVDGCGNDPQTLSTIGGWSMAVAGGNVYWADLDGMYACPTSGCVSAPARAFWSAGGGAQAIAADLGGVYWSSGEIMACGPGGCNGASPVQLTSAGIPAVTQIALDAANVYFVDSNPIGLGQVLACAKSGCGSHPQPLATGLNSPTAIASDGVNVYWTEMSNPDANVALVAPNGAGVVRKCLVSGCNNAPTTIASGLSSPVAIALDDRHVYWAEGGTGSGDGRIWQAPK